METSGIAYECFLQIAERIEKEVGEDCTTKDVVEEFIIPKTKEKKCRYITLIQEEGKNGKPTHFVSHRWGSPFFQLVISITKYFSKKDTSNVFIWLDIFAINQHAGQEQKSDLLALKQRIAQSKQILVSIDEEGLLLTRIWCLYEIWNAFKLPSGAKNLRFLTYFANYDKLQALFVDCDVEKAQALKEEDRKRILQDIKKTVGFKKMNDDIKKALVESAEKEMEEVNEDDLAEKSTKMHKCARIYRFVGRYEESEMLFRKGLEIDEKIYGPEHEFITMDLNNLAQLLGTVGNYEEAEQLYRRALAIDEKIYGPNDPKLATTFNSFAAVLRAKGEYIEAEKFYLRALQVSEQAEEKNYSAIASYLNNLAELISDFEKYEEAESYYKRAIEIAEKADGANHPDLAVYLNNYGLLLNDQKRFDEAAPLFYRALNIDQKVYGADHEKVARDLNSLGCYLYRTEKFEEAETMFLRALNVYEKAFGENHPNVAFTLNNLAVCYRLHGNILEAELHIRRALQISGQLHGENHINVAMNLHNLGQILHMQGKYKEAREMFEKALKICQEKLGPEHSSTKTMANSLQNSFIDKKKKCSIQ